jgi:Pyruvate/2-oxoacid:ferredoxin oxidoreductase delta subunit
MTFKTTSGVGVEIIDRRLKRPPGALNEVLLEDTCTGCGDCMDVCPSGIILLDRHRFPLLLSSSLCSGCGLCAEVCTPEAIVLTDATRAALMRLLEAERTAT